MCTPADPTRQASNQSVCPACEAQRGNPMAPDCPEHDWEPNDGWREG